MAGTIAYVMGPSGAGKDTLLAMARRSLGGSLVQFAHRYITRKPIVGDENFVALSEDEFARRAALQLFALDWAAHGLRYGVGCEIEIWRRAGCTVVVSGSRGHFLATLAQREDIQPILVTAPANVLGERLRRRGREDAAAIAERLERAQRLRIDHPRLRTIVNDAAPEAAAARMIETLTNL